MVDMNIERRSAVSSDAGNATGSSSLRGFVAMMMLDIDKLATHLDRLVERLAHAAGQLLRHSATLRSRRMRSSRGHLAGAQEVIDSLGIFVGRKLFAESRKLIIFLFLQAAKVNVGQYRYICFGNDWGKRTHFGVFDEQTTSLLDLLSENVETTTRDLMSVELGHGLLDMLVIVAVLLGSRSHVEALHKLVD